MVLYTNIVLCYTGIILAVLYISISKNEVILEKAGALS